MTDVNLDDCTLTDLKALQKDLAKAIAGFSNRKKVEARQVLEARARELGFSLAELTGANASRKSLVTRSKTYQNPENPGVTWSGRGRQPAWFKRALEAGMTPDSLAL